MEATGQSLDETIREFEAYRFNSPVDGAIKGPVDQSFFLSLLTSAVRNHDKIDTVIASALVKGWSLSRIDTTLRAVFRCAVAEMMLNRVPGRVTVSESVLIVDAFFPGGSEVSFANGVLDTIGRTLRTADFTTADAPEDGTPQD